MQKLGYVDGKNVSLEMRNAEGQVERLPGLAADLVRAGVDVIVAGGGEAPLRAARQATGAVPL
jgi:putative ABC transport system substrate-binding protein